MLDLRLNEIMKHVGGKRIHGRGDPLIKHVVNRTKKQIKNQTLLFHLQRDPIRGKYWADNQAVAVVTDVPEKCTNLHEEISIIEVSDINKAYWQFIDFYRGRFDIPVIGVTGTCGKTTTKEMIAQILEHDYNIEYTWMSMNSKSVNLRYLMKWNKETEMAVYEMPVAYPGYLSTACRYFKPQIRILLNIDVHHLADCETPEAYMQAKGEIIDGLNPETGILILNGDDENIKRVVDVRPFKHVIYFGKGKGMNFRATKIRYGERGMHFNLLHENNRYDVYVPGVGEHNVYNALAALAAVSSAGVEMKRAIRYLAQFEQVEEHLEFKKGVNGCTVIDDTWNSSPLSMKTGLEVLKATANEKKTMALLGYMPQLGENEFAIQEYRKLGKVAAETGLDQLYIIGKEAEHIGEGAMEAGMNAEKVHFCTTGTELQALLKEQADENTVVFLKITHRVMKQPDFQAFKQFLIPNHDKK